MFTDIITLGALVFLQVCLRWYAVESHFFLMPIHLQTVQLVLLAYLHYLWNEGSQTEAQTQPQESSCKSQVVVLQLPMKV